MITNTILIDFDKRVYEKTVADRNGDALLAGEEYPLSAERWVQVPEPRASVIRERARKTL